MKEDEFQTKHSPTLWEHLKAGFIAAHRRRPLSFYLLLLIPVVLLLGAHIFHGPVSPRHFTLMLTLILVFLWLVSAWAVNDFFMLWRKHRAEAQEVYRETIGNQDFMDQLGRQVKKNPNSK